MYRFLPLLLVLAGAVQAAPYDTRKEVRSFAAEMSRRYDLDEKQLLKLFHGLPRNRAVLKAIAPPSSPGKRSWQAYRDRFAEPQHIAAGLRFWAAHADTLEKARIRYGVPEEVVVAILGIETLYGRDTGRFGLFSALTTLAFDYPPRADLFRGELEDLLLLAKDENRNVLDYRGSYAGALGLPQFLPSSIRRYAVDFDQDGRIDLANPDDAIGSVANFLRQHGWEEGGTICVPALVEGDVAALLAEDIIPRRLPTEMESFGVKVADAPQRPAALIDLATPDMPTEYRLGYGNFFALTRYNRSSFYAAAVTDLATLIRDARRLSSATAPAAND